MCAPSATIHTRAFYQNELTVRMELTEEEYDLTKMKALRSSQIEEAKKAKKWGIVLGTLGRQGNELILERLKAVMKRRGVEYDVLLLSELSDAVVGNAWRGEA